jgi:hypothetical protein
VRLVTIFLSILTSVVDNDPVAISPPTNTESSIPQVIKPPASTLSSNASNDGKLALNHNQILCSFSKGWDNAEDDWGDSNSQTLSGGSSPMSNSRAKEMEAKREERKAVNAGPVAQ